MAAIQSYLREGDQYSLNDEQRIHLAFTDCALRWQNRMKTSTIVTAIATVACTIFGLDSTLPAAACLLSSTTWLSTSILVDCWEFEAESILELAENPRKYGL